MKNALKYVILIGTVMAISGCNNQSNYSGNCFTVNLTKDSYKVKEFTEAFGNYKEKEQIIYNNDNVSLDVANLMPHQIFDDYGVGLFSVRTKDGGQTYDDAYLYYDKELYCVSPIHVRSNQDGFKVYGKVIDVAFTDLNKDDAYEVTVSYQYQENSKSMYLTTLDLMSREMVSSSGFYDTEISLKKKNNEIVIYQNNDFLSNIKPYLRDYEINEPKVTVESINYKVDITWSKYQTHIPVDYPNLTHRFKVDVDMTYLGETFSYEGSYYIETATVSFYKGNDIVRQNEFFVDTALINHTINRGQHLKETYYFIDTFEDKNKSGIYDMEVSYRKETVSKENILTIK